MAPLFLALALVCLSPTSAAAELLLAVVPQLPPAVTHRQWRPLVERLAHDTGLPIQLRVYRSFDEFESDLNGGRPDLVYLNPYQQLVARRAQGYIPLVRDGSRLLSGVLVVRKDSPYQSVKDLDGRDIAFPDPNAFAASLYMRALLREREHIRFQARYLAGHGNVYRHTILGEVAAGGGVNVTLARERVQTRNELRILYETPGTPPHPLSAHPRVNKTTRAVLTAALLKLADSNNGRQLLADIEMPGPVPADQVRDYAALERLNLQRYATVSPPWP
ncbi:MAG: phosphate/phosphite/phosphonate ABC transporter substrate-binding protein [Gammaproteobacteria bacterium]|nr:phosphate/phosphite/phosphonate ABC transporter substrate-binding protein [Gammaproteobacteria bacterium]